MAIKEHRMIRGMLCRIFAIYLFLPGALNLHGQQSPFDPGMSDEAARIVESVECFTDRSLYITGEPVCFRATIRETGRENQGPWSRILYVELVSEEGRRMTEGKYPVVAGVSFGELRIPVDVLSGNYYIRMYTRWMRNRGAETFSYLPIRIINPLRAELEKEMVGEEAQTRLVVTSDEKRILEFETHRASYRRGDQVSLQLRAPGGDLPGDIRGCLTVIPLSARPVDHFFRVESPEPEADSTGNFRLGFLPDRYGPSLSGSVVYMDGREKVMQDTRVHLTLMGETPAYFIGKPDASGRFTVALPFRTGRLELFVQPESPDGEDPEVRIDQDFEPGQLRLQSPSFALSGQERQVATIMARNIQLGSIYREPALSGDTGSANETFPFYGKPTLSVDMDHFILLPTMEEVFLNLVFSVTPVIRRNRTTLKIESVNPAFSLFEPLIMVDQVPVLDWKKFMALPPAKIRRIDVIEDVYVIGDERFGGLINLQSRENDMAGIDLPGNAFFIDYQALYPSSAGRADSENLDEHAPDTRNTLLWLPDLVLKKGTSAEISFHLPDYPGEYVILFRGLGPEGELTVAETSVYVSD